MHVFNGLPTRPTLLTSSHPFMSIIRHVYVLITPSTGVCLASVAREAAIAGFRVLRGSVRATSISLVKRNVRPNRRGGHISVLF